MLIPELAVLLYRNTARLLTNQIQAFQHNILQEVFLFGTLQHFKAILYMDGNNFRTLQDLLPCFDYRHAPPEYSLGL